MKIKSWLELNKILYINIKNSGSSQRLVLAIAIVTGNLPLITNKKKQTVFLRAADARARGDKGLRLDSFSKSIHRISENTLIHHETTKLPLTKTCVLSASGKRVTACFLSEPGGQEKKEERETSASIFSTGLHLWWAFDFVVYCGSCLSN